MQVLEYDIDDIDDEIIEKVRPKVNPNEIMPSILAKTSKVLVLLNQWVHAVIKYYDLDKTTRDKRAVQQQIIVKKNTIDNSANKRRNTIMKLDFKIDQIKDSSATLRAPMVRDVLDEATKVK